MTSLFNGLTLAFIVNLKVFIGVRFRGTILKLHRNRIIRVECYQLMAVNIEAVFSKFAPCD